MNQQFNDLSLTVHETHDSRQWYMTVEEVAKGYGVGRTTVMMHLQKHLDEIRQGIEAGVSIIDTRSANGVEQRRQVTVLYREGVIKLGFFIRSKQAAHFRQWATNLVVQHLDQRGMHVDQLLEELKKDREERRQDTQELRTEIAGVKMVCAGLRDEVDELRGIFEVMISESEANRIRELVLKVKVTLNMDGRAVIGAVRKALNLATVYDKASTRQVINVLRTMLGTGLKKVIDNDKPQPELN